MQPKLIPFLNNIKITKIATSYVHAITLTNNGKVYSWGENGDGQLGLCNRNNVNSPHLVTVLSEKFIKDIHVGGYHVYFSTDSDEYYCCGWNKHGQLGLGHYEIVDRPTLFSFFGDKKIKLFLGRDFTFALTEEGTVYGWGSNASKQLIVDHVECTHLPILIQFFTNKKVIKLAPGKGYCMALLDL